MKKLKRADLYVVRVVGDSEDHTSYSKPCAQCIGELKRYGIYRVFYTTGDIYTDPGAWQCEKVVSLVNDQVRGAEKKRNKLRK